VPSNINGFLPDSGPLHLSFDSLDFALTLSFSLKLAEKAKCKNWGCGLKGGSDKVEGFLKEVKVLLRQGRFDIMEFMEKFLEKRRPFLTYIYI